MRTRGHHSRQRPRPPKPTTHGAPLVFRSTDEPDELRLWNAHPSTWLLHLCVEGHEAVVTVLETTRLEDYLQAITERWNASNDDETHEHLSRAPLQWHAEAIGYATLTAGPHSPTEIKLDVDMRHAADRWHTHASLVLERDQIKQLAAEARLKRTAPAIV